MVVLYLEAEKQGLGSDGLVLSVVSPEDMATVLGRCTVDGRGGRPTSRSGEGRIRRGGRKVAVSLVGRRILKEDI